MTYDFNKRFLEKLERNVFTYNCLYGDADIDAFIQKRLSDAKKGRTISTEELRERLFG